jgi:hypothetical protein
MGTGVFGGMLISTFIATIFVPMFFVLVSRSRRRVDDARVEPALAAAEREGSRE